MLSIVIPAYNEEKQISGTLDLLTKFFKQARKKELRGVDYEIVVALDGPTDRTPQVVEEWQRRNPRIRAIPLPHGGKGWAIANGLKAARGDAIVYDADASAPPKEVLKVVEVLKNYDVAIGSRAVSGAVVTAVPLLRKIASKVFNLLVRLFFGLNIADTQCGFKGIRNEARKKIAPQLSSKGWVWDVEFLYKAKEAGYSMKEFPVEWHHKFGTIELAGTLKTSMKMFLELLALRLRV